MLKRDSLSEMVLITGIRRQGKCPAVTCFPSAKLVPMATLRLALTMIALVLVTLWLDSRARK